MKRRAFITLLGSAVSVFFCVNAAAQEGYYGVGHDKWHQGFYSKRKRNDGQGSCCNLMDCRPTQSRMVGDHYEVKVDGAWTPVPFRASVGSTHISHTRTNCFFDPTKVFPAYSSPLLDRLWATFDIRTKVYHWCCTDNLNKKVALASITALVPSPMGYAKLHQMDRGAFSRLQRVREIGWL